MNNIATADQIAKLREAVAYLREDEATAAAEELIASNAPAEQIEFMTGLAERCYDRKHNLVRN